VLSARLVFGFDRQGNLIESAGYTETGALRSRSTYKYDASNRRVEYDTEPPVAGFEGYTRSYTLDQNGRVVEEKDQRRDGSLHGSRRYTLDAGGRVVEENYYDGAGVSQGGHRWRYDADGNQVEMWGLNGDGIVVRRWENTFRKKGQKMRELTYDSSNRLIGKSESVYAGEQLSEVFDYYGDGRLRWHVVLERNASGLVVKETMLQEDGKVTSVEEITYEHHP
jgi:antitoxin component YwqK of YwqJK toxin-antitoxin module